MDFGGSRSIQDNGCRCMQPTQGSQESSGHLDLHPKHFQHIRIHLYKRFFFGGAYYLRYAFLNSMLLERSVCLPFVTEHWLEAFHSIHFTAYHHFMSSVCIPRTVRGERRVSWHSAVMFSLPLTQQESHFIAALGVLHIRRYDQTGRLSSLCRHSCLQGTSFSCLLSTLQNVYVGSLSPSVTRVDVAYRMSCV